MDRNTQTEQPDISSSIATDDQMKIAKKYGDKKIFSDDDVAVTGYLWAGVFYVTDISIKKGKGENNG
jgi:hypothetical protein